MNKANFQQAGGFPLETDTLDFIQNMFTALQAFAAFGGGSYILSGCVLAGANVSDGWVVISGELLPFKGGLAQTKVVIREVSSTRPFENGSIKDVYYDRVAQFGTGDPFVLFADLKRPKDLLSLTTEIAEKALATTVQTLIEKVEVLQKQAAPFTAGGGMVLWQKPANEIPVGWAEVVNWRGRLPMGWNPDNPYFAEPGQTGGQQTKTLTKAEMPSDLFIDLPNSSSDSGVGAWDSGTPAGSSTRYYLGGGGQAFSLLNPYRIVVFIEYVGGLI